MNKRRRILLLALPLVLGALIGGAKWKQMHPTPTPLDLQERAYLSKATKVEIWSPTYRGEVPIADFKSALDDFYLLENDNAESSTITPARQVVFILKTKSSVGTEDMGMVVVSPVGLYFPFSHSGSHQTSIPLHLRPITHRRLQKLAEGNISAH